METDSQARLLDCGCREGDNTIRLSGRAGTSRIIGLDYNASVLRQAAERGIRPLKADLNFTIPLADHSIDVIVASDVLEHLVDPYTFVGEMYRVLRPGGYALVDTPNLASWHNIFALLIGVQPFSGPNITTMKDADLELVQQIHQSTCNEPAEQAGSGEGELARHIVVIAYCSLLRLFEQHGFDTEKVYGFGYYPFPNPLARWLQRLDPRHAHHIVLKARRPG